MSMVMSIFRRSWCKRWGEKRGSSETEEVKRLCENSGSSFVPRKPRDQRTDISGLAQDLLRRLRNHSMTDVNKQWAPSQCRCAGTLGSSCVHSCLTESPSASLCSQSTQYFFCLVFILCFGFPLSLEINDLVRDNSSCSEPFYDLDYIILVPLCLRMMLH
jgi:hypothetical protein